MPERDTKSIKKRAVFFIGGFDPKSPKAFFGKLCRETERFENLWDVSVSADDEKKLSDDVSLTSYHSSPNTNAVWVVDTDFHFLSLDDIVLKDFNRPLPQRFWRFTVTLADYLFSGTVFSFIKHAWRFSLYFFYPVLMIFLAMLISAIPAMLIINSGFTLSLPVGIAAFLATFTLCAKLGGNRYHVLHLMDLWSFSRDFLRKNRSDIEDKLNNYADLITKQITSTHYDEVLLIGHSTGGALILDVAGRAAERHDSFSKYGNSISILTLGSTALKIGLHPKAKWFRERVQKLFSSTEINWVEYQCLTDVINFFRTDPARLMQIETTPIIRKIRVKEMVSKEVYAKIKRNFFRVHYQFVFGNTKRYHYDFPAICFGPASILDRANHPQSFVTTLSGIKEAKR